MHRWLLEQRRAHRSNSLSLSKIVLLEDLTGWSIDAHQRQLDEGWRARLASLVEFAGTYDRTPRYQTYSTDLFRAMF
ncbi:hypothetical protein ACNPON_16345 [Glutamicibacter sp. AGC13]